MFLFESFWIFLFPAALDRTLQNKLRLVFYEFMKKKRELFCPKFAQVRRLVFSYLYNAFLSLGNHFICLDISVISGICETCISFVNFVYIL